MTKEEMITALKEELKTFKDNLPKYATEEDMTNKLNSIEESMAELNIKDDLTELKEAVEAQGLEINKFNQNSPKKTLSTKEFFEKNKEQLEKLSNKEITSHKFTDRLEKATVQSSDVGSDSAGLYVPGAGRMANRRPFLKELFNNAPLGANSHNTVYYTDQTTDSNAAAVFEEAAAVPSTSDIAWTQYSLDIENVGDSIKVAERSIKNIDFMASEVDFFLRKNVDLKVDGYLFNGTGSNQPFGVTARSTAYAAGSYASKYADANLMDLIRVCTSLISTGTPFVANYVILNPLDAEIYLFGKKDANNNYIIPQNGQLIPLINGVTVVVNNGVTANSMVVGDFTYGTIYQQLGLTVELGFVDDDFQKNLITMKAYEELNLLIRSVHQGAFRYVSDIATALTGLESGA